MDGTRIALITGANRGIGFEVARQLARRGYQVILSSRTEANARKAADRLMQESLHTDPMELDVRLPSQVNAARRRVEREYQRLDVLVNNAAVYLDRGISAMEVESETVEQTMNVNFLGPLRLCQVFVPMMIQQDYGRVVNVTSSLGQLEGMGGGAMGYRASKTALNALTKVFAAETGEYDIKVNSVVPGWVQTRMGGPGAPLTVEEGADTVVWLATLPSDGPSGGLFEARHTIHW